MMKGMLISDSHFAKAKDLHMCWQKDTMITAAAEILSFDA
jgi:hypothetical protein